MRPAPAAVVRSTRGAAFRISSSGAEGNAGLPRNLSRSSERDKKHEFFAIFERDGDWLVAYCPKYRAQTDRAGPRRRRRAIEAVPRQRVVKATSEPSLCEARRDALVRRLLVRGFLPEDPLHSSPRPPPASECPHRLPGFPIGRAPRQSHQGVWETRPTGLKSLGHLRATPSTRRR